MTDTPALDAALEQINREDIIADILAERRRNVATWGSQDHYADINPVTLPFVAEEYERSAKATCDRWTQLGHPNWIAVIEEEVAEAATAAAKLSKPAARHELFVLRAEIVQVAAVALAWLESVDRRIESDT